MNMVRDKVIINLLLTLTSLQIINTDEKLIPSKDNGAQVIALEKNTSMNTLAIKDYHSAGFLLCNQLGKENNSSIPKCNLTLNTHVSNRTMDIKFCVIEPSRENENIAIESIKVLNYEKILVGWIEKTKDTNYYITYQIITMSNCKSSRCIRIHTKILPTSPIIIQRKNNFDIISNEQTYCPENRYCKSTYNFEGELLTKYPEILFPTEKPFRILSMHAEDFKSIEGYFIVAERKYDGKTIMHSPIFGWKLLDAEAKYYYYADSTGTATLCWELNSFQNLRCLWYGRNQTDYKNIHMEFDFERFLLGSFRTNGEIPCQVFVVTVGSSKTVLDKKNCANV